MEATRPDEVAARELTEKDGQIASLKEKLRQSISQVQDETRAELAQKQQRITSLEEQLRNQQKLDARTERPKTPDSLPESRVAPFKAESSIPKAAKSSRQLHPQSSLDEVSREELRLFGQDVPSTVQFVVGFGSVSRKKDYVLETVGNMLGLHGGTVVSAEERQRVVVVAHLADFDMSWVSRISSQLQREYSGLVASGNFHGIHAPQEVYPSLDICPPFCSYKDDPHRVTWRSKQNMDYAFLMYYAAPLAPYYLQIEDDLNFASNWISSMEQYLNKAYPAGFLSKENAPWRLIDFSQLGFIGKLFQSQDLPRMAQFLLLFYDQMPCDLLLGLWMKAMTQGKRIDYWKKQPSLFQHVGLFRSLGGIQPLQETKFGKQLFNNPPGSVVWNMTILPTYEGKFTYWPGGEPANRNDICDFKASKAHKSVKVKRCWFWGKQIQRGDHLTIVFERASEMKAVLVEFGHGEHPKDLLEHGTIEVAAPILPAQPQLGSTSALRSCGEFHVLTEVTGQQTVYWEEGTSTPPKLPIPEMRCLRVAASEAQKAWVVIQRIQVRTATT